MSDKYFSLLIHTNVTKSRKRGARIREEGVRKALRHSFRKSLPSRAMML